MQNHWLKIRNFRSSVRIFLSLKAFHTNNMLANQFSPARVLVNDHSTNVLELESDNVAVQAYLQNYVTVGSYHHHGHIDVYHVAISGVVEYFSLIEAWVLSHCTIDKIAINGKRSSFSLTSNTVHKINSLYF